MNPTNLATQNLLMQKMLKANELGWKFSQAGMHYLACRWNGILYKKAVEAGMDLLLAKELQNRLGTVCEEVRAAFGWEKVRDEALLILATGRKPLLDRKGFWKEEQSSLLNWVPMSESMLATLTDSRRQEVRKVQSSRLQQQILCTQLFSTLTKLYDEQHPGAMPEKVKRKAKLRVVEELSGWIAPDLELDVGTDWVELSAACKRVCKPDPVANSMEKLLRVAKVVKKLVQH